jgi:hypothetical protein
MARCVFRGGVGKSHSLRAMHAGKRLAAMSAPLCRSSQRAHAGYPADHKRSEARTNRKPHGAVLVFTIAACGENLS